MNTLLKDKKLAFLSLIILINILICIIGVLAEVNLLIDISKTLIITLTALVYLFYKEKETLFFGMFLFFLTLSEYLFHYYTFNKNDVIELILRILYVIVYASLFNQVVADIKFFILLRKHFFMTIIALSLGVFVFVKFNDILNYHNMMFNDLRFAIDLSHYLFIILTLVFSLLHYVYHKSRKSLFLFLGAFCISVGNYIEIATYYFTDYIYYIYILNVIIFCLAFFFFWRFITYNYIFSTLKNYH